MVLMSHFFFSHIFLPLVTLFHPYTSFCHMPCEVWKTQRERSSVKIWIINSMWSSCICFSSVLISPKESLIPVSAQQVHAQFTGIPLLCQLLASWITKLSVSSSFQRIDIGILCQPTWFSVLMCTTRSSMTHRIYVPRLLPCTLLNESIICLWLILKILNIHFLNTKSLQLSLNVWSFCHVA
jgi:hypothetical protein